MSKASASASSSSRSLAEHAAHEGAVVGFDTATADTAVCATRAGEVLYEELIGPAADAGPRHSTALLAEVERAAAAAGGWGGVERIAVGLGPGSFVGIRIGITTALGLGVSTGLPVTGVCTLDALGVAIAERTRLTAPPSRIGEGQCSGVAVLDARRGEVFAAFYAATGERLGEPQVLAPEALAARLDELPAPVLAAGSGAVRFRDELSSRDVEIPDDVDPLHRIAARHVCAPASTASTGSDERLEPIYLRPPDAQRWRERDTSPRPS